MAIIMPSGFVIGSPEPIDSRLVLSKEEMLGTYDILMPDVYYAVCKDDGKLYLYNKENSVDPVTGKYRLVQSEINPKDSSILVEDNKIGVQLSSENNSIELAEDGLKLDFPKALKESLEDQSKLSGLEVDSEGNISISFNEDHLMLNENNQLDLAVDLIQAII